MTGPQLDDESRLARRLYGGSARLLIVYAIGSGLSFGVHLLLARMLGAMGYGNFVYATSWMAILILGCHVGLKPTVVRFAAAYKAHEQWDLLSSLITTATRWIVVASSVVLTSSIILLFFVRPQFDDLGLTLLLVAFAMPFMAVSEVWSSFIRGLGGVIRSQLPASIVQHGLVGLSLIIIFNLGWSAHGAISGAAAFLSGTIMTLGVTGWLLRSEFRVRKCARINSNIRREWRHVACGNVLISIFQAVRTPLVVVISGIYLDAPHIAYLVAAQRLANIASMALFGISGVSSPLIAQYFALDDFSKLQHLAKLAARATFGAAILASVLLIGFGVELLRLFGEGFETAYQALLILLIGELAASATGPVGFLLNMTGRQMTATRIEGGVSIIAIVLALLLIPAYGIVGAAAVIATCSTIRNIVMLIAVSRHLKIRASVF